MEQHTPDAADPSPSSRTPTPQPGAPRPSSFPFLAPAQAPDEVGRLGGFRLLRLLGDGGMGVVFEAEDPTLKRRIALKMMKSFLAADPSARDRFTREARAAAAVKHKHVVVIYQVGEDRGVPFLAMELLDGESLSDRLRREGKLPSAVVVRIGREIAEGLAAAHERGLIHRDVKPLNLWLETGTGNVKILDFGLARAAIGDDQLTPAGGILGTPAYMAPEQARGEDVDARCDLFSLGVVLYRMTTGVAPFEAPTHSAALLKVATHHPAPPHTTDPSVPAALSDLVMRLLAKEPAGRPASAREVVDALAAIEGSFSASTLPPAVAARPSDPLISPASVPSSPTPTPLLVPVAPPRQSRRWKRPLAAAIALTALVGLFLSPLLLPRVRAWLFSPAAQPAVPPAPAAYKGYIDVTIYDPSNPHRQYVRLNGSDVVPLKAGDGIAIEAEMNPPAYLYVLWIDADGTVDPVYPWEPGDWNTRPVDEQPVGRLLRPADGFYPLKPSAPGMETLVLLARETPLPQGVDLKAELGKVEPQTLQKLESTVWFENGAVVTKEQGRSAVGWNERKIGDPVQATQGLIRSRLGKWFPYTRAVSFGDRGQ